MPPVEGFVEFLEEWRSRLAQSGVPLRVSTDGGRFDVHAPQLDLASPDVGLDPIETFSAALDELVARIPDGSRSRLHSTLRTIEYGGGAQRRTLYALRETGELARVTDESAGEPQPIADVDEPRRPHWSLWAAIAIFIMLVALSAPQILARLGMGSAPEPSAISVESAPGGYELVGLDQSPDDGGRWRAALRHGSDLPEWLSPAGGSTIGNDTQLFQLAVKRGLAQLEWRDRAGVLLRVDPLDVAPLATAGEAEVLVPAPPRGSTSVRLSW